MNALEVLLALDEKIDVINSSLATNTALIQSNQHLIEQNRGLILLILGAFGSLLLILITYFINKK